MSSKSKRPRSADTVSAGAAHPGHFKRGQLARLRRRINEQPFVLLDGGLATTLEERGHDLGDALWSARLLRDEPTAIVEVHREFLRAGAEVLVTASYQATLQGLEAAGASPAEAAMLLRRSVGLAVEASDLALAAGEIERPAVVAASIGPYGAYLADGSEYVGDYALDRAGLRAFHRPRWQLLAAECDVLACETLPSRSEAEALLDLLGEHPEVGAWFSFSCRDGRHIADGTRLSECVALCGDNPQVIAVGLNCTAPQFVDSLIAEAKTAAPDLPIVIYPNSGEIYDAATHGWSGESRVDSWAVSAVGWWRAGARLIGGCCRTNPEAVAGARHALEVAARGL